jgi:osmotically-inducible protein OsmY
VLKRLFAFVLLLALVAAGLYYAKMLPPGLLPKGLSGVGQRIEDVKVRAAVTAALRLNRQIQDAAIEVGSDEGVVTLRGNVASEASRGIAERVAAAVPDVTQVVNHLKVVASPPASNAAGRSMGENLDDHALEVQVRLALSLRRELKGSDVDVRAFRREVTLTGEVADAGTRKVAEETARDTAGVAGVKDDLRLRGEAAPEASAKATPKAVQKAIRANPNLEKFNIAVTAGDRGRLVLRGVVRTGAEKDLAGLLAREAAGAPVDNALQIHP